MVERAFICPPCSQIGPITPEDRERLIKKSPVFGVYERYIDRESAYEILMERMEEERRLQAKEAEEVAAQKAAQANTRTTRTAKKQPNILEELSRQTGRAITRTISNDIGRQLARGLLGSIFGGSRKR
jgi:uncharacterized protein